MFCNKCGKEINDDAIVCIYCGSQVADFKGNNPNIVITNTNTNTNTNVNENSKKKINKVVALLLCIFLGFFGAHKFYEGKIGMGILYLCTGGLFVIGWLIDIFIIACKPNPYYV